MPILVELCETGVIKTYLIPDFCATLYTAHNTTNLPMLSKILSPYQSETRVLRVQVRAGCVLQTYLNRMEQFQVRISNSYSFLMHQFR